MARPAPMLRPTPGLALVLQSPIGFLLGKLVLLSAKLGLMIVTRGKAEDEWNLLDPELLSSGEKQLLLLLCNALAARDHASVFIIDEPELSLNVKWQRQLIAALLDLTKGTKGQFVVASHSTELYAQHLPSVRRLDPSSGKVFVP